MATLPGQNYVSGPRVGGQPGGRRRNTMMNIASKQYFGSHTPPGKTPPIIPRGKITPQAPTPPAPAPNGTPGNPAPGPTGPVTGGLTMAQVLGLQGQLQGTTYDYLNSLASLRLAAAGAKGTFASAVPMIRQQAAQNITGIEANSLDRGILGSSIDLQGRATERGAMAANIVGARADMAQQLQQVALQRAQAQQQYQLGLLGVAQQRAAYIGENSIQNYQNGLAGVGNLTAAQFQALVRKFLRRYAGPTGTGAPTTTQSGTG